MSEHLQIVRNLVDSSMFILIWLVQLIIYPAFRSIDAAVFSVWHQKYMSTISLFVIPLILVQAVCIGLQLQEQPDAATLAAGVVVLAAWLVTFTISVPCHQRLKNSGKNEAVIARLISTNWLRTACWTLAWLLGIFG